MTIFEKYCIFKSEVGAGHDPPGAMRWEDILDRYDVDLPDDEPILPVSVVCHLVGIQYYLLHELLKEGIVARAAKKKNTKLLSLSDVKKIKYAKYLIEEKGVNIRGVKVIFEMED